MGKGGVNENLAVAQYDRQSKQKFTLFDLPERQCVCVIMSVRGYRSNVLILNVLWFFVVIFVGWTVWSFILIIISLFFSLSLSFVLSGTNCSPHTGL